MFFDGFNPVIAGFVGGFFGILLWVALMFVVVNYMEWIFCLVGSGVACLKKMFGITPQQSGNTETCEEQNLPQMRHFDDWMPIRLYWRSSALTRIDFEDEVGEKVYVGGTWVTLNPVSRSAVQRCSLALYEKSQTFPSDTNTKYSSLNLPCGTLSMLNSTMYWPTSDGVSGVPKW